MEGYTTAEAVGEWQPFRSRSPDWRAHDPWRAYGEWKNERAVRDRPSHAFRPEKGGSAKPKLTEEGPLW
jgi:hypothetical protein